jgi:ABC-type uncharacterized transport system permease subunit
MSISSVEFERPRWQMIICSTLAFWISGCLLLDLVIMPSLYVSGMLTDPGFSSAGSMLFGMFNHIELVCAALVITGILALNNLGSLGKHGKLDLILSMALLGITLILTYALTPQMSALGAELNLFNPINEIPVAMNQLHGGYFSLELIKITLAATLLKWSFDR